MRIIFVRHGLTVYNAESRIQGHQDIELSELGRRQAARVAERLQSENLAAVYSSDLRRASETAEAIAAYHGLEVKADPSLRECSFGDWEGMTVSEIQGRYPDLWANYRRDSIANRAPGGERLEQLQDRVVKSIEAIAEHHPQDTIAIVLHGGPIKAFFCHALGAHLRTFRSIQHENTSLTIFTRESDGQWFLETLNDHCHLRDLEATGLDETSAK